MLEHEMQDHFDELPSPSSNLGGSDPYQWNKWHMPNAVDSHDVATSGADLEQPDMSSTRTEAQRCASTRIDLEKVRVEQETVLISTYTTDQCGDNAAEGPCWRRLPSLVLTLYGVLPFGAGKFAGICGNFAKAVCACVLVFCLHASWDEGVNIHSVVCACYALGGALALHSLHQMRIGHIIGTSATLLEQYAIHHGFQGAWEAKSLRLLGYVSLPLMVATVLNVLLIVTRLAVEDEDDIGLISMVAMIVCAGLELMVDTFCGTFMNKPDFKWGVTEWNTVQALMRRAAQIIDLCFLIVQTSVFAALFLTGMNVALGYGTPQDAFRVLPVSFAMMGIMLFGQCKAAGVTEKCLRAPALMNSLVVEGVAINVERQYLVQYIMQSGAGFYVRGVRLTAFMVLKGAYLCVMVTLGSVMRLSRSDSDP